MQKYFSRKLVTLFAFGIGTPVLFHTLGLSEQITTLSLYLAGAYIGVNGMVAFKHGDK